MVLIFEKIINKFIAFYYKKVFIDKTKNKKAEKLSVIGKVNVYNPNIRIGSNVTLYENVTFWGDGQFIIGDNVKIGQNTILYASKEGGICIGSNTIIAANNYIIDSNHCIKKNKLISSQKMNAEKLIIGEDVWIGANCVIIQGAKINNGAVIGAHTLINSVIADYAIAVGSPGKVIKFRE